MNCLGRKWNHFWFEPASPDNLGLARILLFGSMSLFYLVTPIMFPSWGYHATFHEWGAISHVFFHPIWLFKIFRLPQLSVRSLIVIEIIWKISLVTSAIGFFTKPSTILAFLLSTYLFALPNNFGKVEHTEILLVWAFGVMALSHCGDAWSIDARLHRTERKISPEYTWPIRLIWVAMALTYFEAGVSKLRHSGLRWVTGNTMSTFLIKAQYHITNIDPLTQWGLYIAQHPMLSHFFAASGLIIELSYTLALFSRRLRCIIIPSGMLMQTGVAILMGPNFYQMIICQLLWIPLDKVARATSARLNHLLSRNPGMQP